MCLGANSTTDKAVMCNLTVLRRPVGQATRYGEWYTGNDTDLDEQLLEYNTAHPEAVFSADAHLERRSSDLVNYTADQHNTDSSDDEGKAAAGKKRSHLRRSILAPGQVCTHASCKLTLDSVRH